MTITKAKMLESSARRFPWGREDAEKVVASYNAAGQVLSELSEVVGKLEDSDEFDVDGIAKRSKRRLLRSVVECMAELNDTVEWLYAKYPDLAPEDLRRYYTA